MDESIPNRRARLPYGRWIIVPVVVICACIIWQYTARHRASVMQEAEQNKPKGMIDPRAVDSGGDAGSLALTRDGLADFVRNTSSYEGRTVTVDWLYRRSGGKRTLAELLEDPGAQSVRFETTFGVPCKIVVKFPRNREKLVIPDVDSDEPVAITFDCMGGSLTSGNIVRRIVRR